jgi:hypothetical protein
MAARAAAGAAAAALELDAAAAVGRPGFPIEVAGIAAALAVVALLVRMRPPADRDRRQGRRG